MCCAFVVDEQVSGSPTSEIGMVAGWDVEYGLARDQGAPLCANVPRSTGEERSDEAEAKTSSFHVVAIVSPVPWLETVHDMVTMVPA